jgi:hypothetical protein
MESAWEYIKSTEGLLLHKLLFMDSFHSFPSPQHISKTKDNIKTRKPDSWYVDGDDQLFSALLVESGVVIRDAFARPSIAQPHYLPSHNHVQAVKS